MIWIIYKIPRKYVNPLGSVPYLGTELKGNSRKTQDLAIGFEYVLNNLYRI